MTRTQRRTAPRAPAVALALAGVLALAACGGGSTPEPSDTPTTPAASPTATPTETAGTPSPGHTTEPTDGATSPPPFPANTEPDTAEASPGAQLLLTDIRLGGHDGFDRVVLQVGGTGTPGWDVRYVDEATSQGSGHELDIAGDAVLQVSLTGAGYPYETHVDEYAAPPLTAPGTSAVTEVVFDATFEGTSLAFVGTVAKNPFRVYALENPTRVVLEVAHSG
jgi:hypothetical protein